MPTFHGLSPSLKTLSRLPCVERRQYNGGQSSPVPGQLGQRGNSIPGKALCTCKSHQEELMKATVKKGSKNRMKSAKELVRDAKKAGGKLKKKVMGK